MKYGLDTSAILRIITSEPYPLAEKVQSRVAEIIAAGGEFVISELPASEAYYSLQHFYGRTKEEAIMALRALAEEDGISFSPEAAAALATPDAWKANPGFVDRMIVNGYSARGHVTLSCEKDFRRLDLTEVIS